MASSIPLADFFAFRTPLLSFDEWLRWTSAAPAVASLAPFCDLNPGLRTQVERCLRSEEALRPEATWAEIVHLPDGADADGLARPLLAEHEIPFFGRSGAAPERRIPITDLWLSVVGERLRLTSRRLGREIIPRLSAPHDGKDRRNLSVYRFLSALQAQGTANGLSWSWGALEDAAFLPRVTAGRVVLCDLVRRLEVEARLDQQLAEKYESLSSSLKEMLASDVRSTFQNDSRAGLQLYPHVRQPAARVHRAAAGARHLRSAEAVLHPLALSPSGGSGQA